MQRIWLGTLSGQRHRMPHILLSPKRKAWSLRPLTHGTEGPDPGVSISLQRCCGRSRAWSLWPTAEVKTEGSFGSAKQQIPKPFRIGAR